MEEEGTQARISNGQWCVGIVVLSEKKPAPSSSRKAQTEKDKEGTWTFATPTKKTPTKTPTE
jgi:hypothetical protein